MFKHNFNVKSSIHLCLWCDLLDSAQCYLKESAQTAGTNQNCPLKTAANCTSQSQTCIQFLEKKSKQECPADSVQDASL